MFTSLIEPYFSILLPSMRLCRYYNSTKISELQNPATRIATNSLYDVSSEPLLQELVWLYIEQLIQLETVIVVYKALHNEAPCHKEELFHKLSNTRSRELRNSLTDLYIARLRTSLGQTSFAYGGVCLWNKG